MSLERMLRRIKARAAASSFSLTMQYGACVVCISAVPVQEIYNQGAKGQKRSINV